MQADKSPEKSGETREDAAMEGRVESKTWYMRIRRASRKGVHRRKSLKRKVIWSVQIQRRWNGLEEQSKKRVMEDQKEDVGRTSSLSEGMIKGQIRDENRKWFVEHSIVRGGPAVMARAESRRRDWHGCVLAFTELVIRFPLDLWVISYSMKAPPNGFVPNSGEGERKNINSELWHACAGPLVSLPPVGSLVVYFPQGHSEQVAASMNKETDFIPNYPNLPSKLVCMLHNVILHV
ncbi:Auxin response factor 19, partial [Cucurbita argyrosperma subsp. argyrosperma]